MRILQLLLFICLPFLLKAQKMAIGGYVTPTYGNIAYKSDFYYPTFTIGGGLNFNYYKNRWLFSTGVNFKNSSAYQKIPITTVNQPDGNGDFAKAFYTMYVMTIPVGVGYAIVNKENFKLFGGLTVENGYVLNKRIDITNKDFNYKMKKELEKGYYLGIMPEIRMELNLSPKIFLFSKMGLSYQLNNLKIEILNSAAFIPEEWKEPYKINNLFMDIGFGYRLKN